MSAKISHVEIDLLSISSKDLIQKLAELPNHSSVKQCAFQYHNSQNNELFQVQVIVTRAKRDFLEDFQTRYMLNNI